MNKTRIDIERGTGNKPNRSVEVGLMKGMELSLKATMDLGLGHQQGME